MNAILYMLTFPSGKIYIGVTTGTVKNRIVRHVSHSKSRDYAVHRAIRKYGREGIVARTLAVGSRDYILDLEQRAIAAFGTLVPTGYNQSLGGDGVRVPTFTAEHRVKLASAKRGKPGNNPNGTRHTLETRKKISEANRGRPVSAETRKKIGITKIGNKYGQKRRAACAPSF